MQRTMAMVDLAGSFCYTVYINTYVLEMQRIMKLPTPGARMAAILSLVPRCHHVAEIGADHGITSAHLLKDGICQTMTVTDISAASLDKARRLFLRHGLDGQAAFRVADGLHALETAVDAIVISGMGAHTICDILADGQQHIGDAALILQANADVPLLRAWLAGHGFSIEDEKIAQEGRRWYIVMRAARGETAYTEKELFIGPCLMKSRPEGYLAYTAWRRECLAKVQNEETALEMRWLEEEMQ